MRWATTSWEDEKKNVQKNTQTTHTTRTVAAVLRSPEFLILRKHDHMMKMKMMWNFELFELYNKRDGVVLAWLRYAYDV